MNARQRDIAICYALARYGRMCYHCSTSIEDLIEEAELKAEIEGKERKLPVIILDKLNNDGVHSNPTDPDLVPSCWSCNRNKNKHDLSQSSGREPSREKLDTLTHEPAYHTNLENKLQDDEHLCFNEMKYAGKELSEGMNEVTALRYFNSKKLTNANPKGRYQLFPYNCGSPDCNGNHVCLNGMVPKGLLEREVHILKNEYDGKYMNGDENRFKTHTATSHQVFIPFREYYTQHTKLLKHFSGVSLDDLGV